MIPVARAEGAENVDLVGRNVLAYFTRREHAERARSVLRQEGFDTVQLDRISRYGGESAQELHSPLTGNIDSLADLSAGADTDGGDAGALIAADTSASGLAHGHDYDPGIQERTWVVTVVTGEDRINRAVQILEDTGGTV